MRARACGSRFGAAATPRPAARRLATLAVLVATAGAIACSGGAPAGPLVLSFGHVGAPGSLYALTANELARRVEAEMGDRLRLQVFGSSQLGR